jgi:hypothetical protein
MNGGDLREEEGAHRTLTPWQWEESAYSTRFPNMNLTPRFSDRRHAHHHCGQHAGRPHQVCIRDAAVPHSRLLLLLHLDVPPRPLLGHHACCVYLRVVVGMSSQILKYGAYPMPKQSKKLARMVSGSSPRRTRRARSLLRSLPLPAALQQAVSQLLAPSAATINHGTAVHATGSCSQCAPFVPSVRK